jgi:hypothetical protein
VSKQNNGSFSMPILNTVNVEINILELSSVLEITLKFYLLSKYSLISREEVPQYAVLWILNDLGHIRILLFR